MRPSIPPILGTANAVPCGRNGLYVSTRVVVSEQPLRFSPGLPGCGGMTIVTEYILHHFSNSGDLYLPAHPTIGAEGAMSAPSGGQVCPPDSPHDLQDPVLAGHSGCDILQKSDAELTRESIGSSPLPPAADGCGDTHVASEQDNAPKAGAASINDDISGQASHGQNSVDTDATEDLMESAGDKPAGRRPQKNQKKKQAAHNRWKEEQKIAQKRREREEREERESIEDHDKQVRKATETIVSENDSLIWDFYTATRPAEDVEKLLASLEKNLLGTEHDRVKNSGWVESIRKKA